MGDLEKILLSNALPLIAGVIVFTAGQFVQRFVFEPLQEFNKLRGEIGHDLIYYSNVFGNGGIVEREEFLGMMAAVRQKASRLRQQPDVIPFYDQFAKRGWVRDRDAIYRASGRLIFLSNATDAGLFDDIGRSRTLVASVLRLRLDD